MSSRTVWGIMTLTLLGILGAMFDGVSYILAPMIIVAGFGCAYFFSQEHPAFGITQDDKALLSTALVPALVLMLTMTSGCALMGNKDLNASNLSPAQKTLVIADGIQTSFMSAKNAYITIYNAASDEKKAKMEEKYAPIINAAQLSVQNFVAVALVWAETQQKPADIEAKKMEALRGAGEAIGAVAVIEKEKNNEQ